MYSSHKSLDKNDEESICLTERGTKNQILKKSNENLEINKIRVNENGSPVKAEKGGGINEKGQSANEKSVAITVRNACKSYGENVILKNLNMTIDEGSIYTLLGASGCGKTTILNCICGINTIDSGEIEIFGNSPSSKSSGVPGNRVGYMPQEISLFGEFKIEEALNYFGKICGMTSDKIKSRTDFLVELLNLPKKSRLIKSLSGGQKRRVSFASTLIHEAPILILDEPTVGVDALLRECIWTHLISLTKELNQTVIITTHYIEEAAKASKIGMMRNGRLIEERSPEKLFEIYKQTDLQKIVLKLCYMDEQISIEVKTENNEGNKEKEYSGGNNAEIVQLISLRDEDKNLKSKNVPWTKNTGAVTRLKALIYRNSIKILRFLPFVIFCLFMPTLAVLLFGYAVGGDIRGLKIGVVNYEVGMGYCFPFGEKNVTSGSSSEFDGNCIDLSCEFLSKFPADIINFIEFENETNALDALNSANIWGYLVIPEKFSKSLIKQLDDEFKGASKDHKIRMNMDMTRQPITYKIFSKLLSSLDLFTKEMSSRCTFYNYIDHADYVDFKALWGDVDISFVKFTLPSLLITIIFFISITLSGLIVNIEKKEGMYERALVSGASRSEIILSHLCSQFIIMLLQIVFALIIAFFWFEIPLEGSSTALVLFIVNAGLLGLLIGFAISLVLTEESSVFQSSMGISIIIILLSGLFWPYEGQPHILRYVSYVLPTTLPSTAMRGIMMKGFSMTHPVVLTGFGVSGSWTVASIILLYFLNRSLKTI